jgi:hypothetical protein
MFSLNLIFSITVTVLSDNVSYNVIQCAQDKSRQILFSFFQKITFWEIITLKTFKK